MDIRWIQNAQAAFIRIYGGKKGEKVCAAVLSGVMADFRKTLAASAPGIPCRETYRIDDNKADLLLEGRRTETGPVLTRLEVGGIAVDLGGAELKL